MSRPADYKKAFPSKLESGYTLSQSNAGINLGEKGENAGASQTVHHDGVTSEVDRFSSEPVKKAIGRTRTVDLDANDRQRAPRSNDGRKSLSQSNLGD